MSQPNANDLEPPPSIRRAGEALHTAWSDLPRELYGPAASEALATAALAAGLDVEEMAAGALYDHWPIGAGYECKCGVVTGDPASFTRHQATALRASILGGDA